MTTTIPNLFDEGIANGADISPCGNYRYKLWRTWRQDRPTLSIIGLNPSTADATQDDPTIRRCIGFAKSWGYGGLIMLNLFAWRATNPSELYKSHGCGINVVGELTDDYITANVQKINVAAWGVNKTLGRDKTVRAIFNGSDCPLHVFRLTTKGCPCHPLYLPRDITGPTEWLTP